MSFTNNTPYYLMSSSNGNYLNRYGVGAPSNNQNVTTYSATGNPDQRWRFVDAGNGNIRIVSELNNSFGLNVWRGSSNYFNCDIRSIAGNANDSLIKAYHLSMPGMSGTSLARVKFQLVNYPNYYLTAVGNDVRWQADHGTQAVDQLWLPLENQIGGATSSNYLVYPCRTMNITQNHSGGYSHANCSQGTPADYPIDDACDNQGRSYMYCPCDEMEIIRIYGVGSSGTNTIWLRSTSQVITPSGNDHVVMMVIHPNDDDLSTLYVGQKFSRGEAMFREGTDGQVTGNHFHFSIGKGNISGTGWQQNNLGSWVLTTTNGNLLPTNAYYLDSDFTTTIINSSNYNFTSI